MRLFSCQACSHILFFENTRCERCGHTLGYWPDRDVMSALEPTAEDGTWTALGMPGRRFRLCANAAHHACNWLVDADTGARMCGACRHNRIIPRLAELGELRAWRKIEVAKHRLFFSLYKLGLPQRIEMLRGAEPLLFKFLADKERRVMTGHNRGTITIALAEADDAEREQRRTRLGEPYRTLLGHFRHEAGHYFWNKLVRDGGRLDACRAVFGDDTLDYRQRLQRHYRDGAPPDWQTHFVSAYAAMHPWEDFAETWAHYLHIVDTLEMAFAYGLSLSPALDREGRFRVATIDPYEAAAFGDVIRVWLPVSTALNSMTMAMGKEELYPFLLSPAVIEKLGFVHDLVRRAPHRDGR